MSVMIGLLCCQTTPESQWLKTKTCICHSCLLPSLGFLLHVSRLQSLGWRTVIPLNWANHNNSRGSNASNFIFLESEALCFHLQIIRWNLSHNSTNHKGSRKYGPNLCPKGRRTEAFGKPEEWLPHQANMTQRRLP